MLDNYFNTLGLTWGVLLILGIGIVLFLIVAIILEHTTRKKFPERPADDDGDSGFLSFDDDDA